MAPRPTARVHPGEVIFVVHTFTFLHRARLPPLNCLPATAFSAGAAACMCKYLKVQGNGKTVPYMCAPSKCTQSPDRPSEGQ